MEITLLIKIFWLHTVGDFFFQSRKVANAKSSNNIILLYHSIVYCLPLMIISFKFAVINCVLHCLVDYVTSKLNHRWYSTNNIKAFFNTIGIDQAIHMSFLVLTYGYYIKGV